MRNVLGFVAIGMTLMACTAAPATDEGVREIEGLDGKAHSVEDGATSSSSDTADSRVAVDGQPVDVRFDGTTLRVASGARVLTLRHGQTGSMVAQFDDVEHGEHAAFEAPAVSMTPEAALAAARGHVVEAQLKRNGVLTPAAVYAIGRWNGASRAAADSLLASWINALAHMGEPATSAAGNVAPRRRSSGCDTGTECSIKSSTGYSCSVSCTQGWFAENCSYCNLSSSGNVSCSCDW